MSSSTTPLMAANEMTMMVVFGRPGSGKSTVANAAINLLSSEQDDLHCVGLDLDVCVPQWMRDNFSRGIYPSLNERQEFAASACDYIDTKLLEESALREGHNIVVIISFSFVNTDLRETFRSRFPHALWALVDTTVAEANDRINNREGHFYKGAPPRRDKADEASLSLGDNREWEFAPVTFQHIVLPGGDLVETNARSIVDKILSELQS